MNEIVKHLKSHRSCRNYQKGYKIPKEEISEIIECSKQAPSWMNGQHYSIIVINDEEIKSKLFEISGQKHIDTSSVFLLYVADLTRMNISCSLEGTFFDIENNKDILITASMDVALAMQNAAVAAESLGYGTVFCGGIRNKAKELIEIFNLPRYVYPVCGLSIGKLDLDLTTEKVKPRLKVDINVGENKYPVSTEEQILDYNRTMEEFAEARETMMWSEKFSKFYSGKPNVNNNEILKKQGF